MDDIPAILSEQLYELVKIDTNCEVDEDAYLDSVNYQRLHEWYEKTRRILVDQRVKSSLIARFTSLLIMDKNDYAEYEIFKNNVIDFKSCLKGIIEYYEQNETKTHKVRKLGKKVFIIHGHDETNLLKLQKLITDRFDLDVVVLKDAPRTSRHLLQKFEEETSAVGFVFALFTPDDFTIKENEEYYEARPNVIFELGWFYAKLGGKRVSILLKEGTKIPSDIEGIDRIEFIKFINEQLEQIEVVLKSANLIDD